LSAINRPPAPVDYGKANVCARCHQARVATPVDFNAATYKVTSSRFGPHHGVQAQALMGLSAIQFPGVDPYPVGNHKGTQNACVTCHMATAVGDLGGGHTFKVAYEEGGSELFNFAGCLTSGCHTETASQLTTIFKAKQDEIKAKIIILRDKLVAKGWLVKSTTNPDDFLLDMWKATSGAPINATPIEAAVMYNYKTVVEDKSIGIHNPKYVLAVLNASIDKLP
jgi:formate-dependent nitrite reductase cytochrome c552 subunit